MIDAKQAILIAKAKAAEILDQAASNVEEIERQIYDGHDVWSITLSLPRDLNYLPAFVRLSADPLQYKRFLIDVETGGLIAMKIRDVATQ
jgi:hypothetical protein